MDEVTKPVEKKYKVQYFDGISMSWMDIQKTCNNLQDCENALMASKKCRIMVIEGKKRYPIQA